MQIVVDSFHNVDDTRRDAGQSGLRVSRSTSDRSSGVSAKDIPERKSGIARGRPMQSWPRSSKGSSRRRQLRVKVFPIGGRRKGSVRLTRVPGHSEARRASGMVRSGAAGSDLDRECQLPGWDGVGPVRWTRGQDNGPGTVLPRRAERIANLAVILPFEALGTKRRPGHVSAHAFEPASVATIDRGSHVNVNTTDLGDERSGCRLGVADRPEDLSHLNSRTLTQRVCCVGAPS